MASTERDYPVGHPSSVDYDPNSPEAIEWKRINLHPAGERDFPVGHFAAADNPNRVEPSNPFETSRDFSRPHTIPANEYEGVTGLNHAEESQKYMQAEAAAKKKRQA